MPEIVRAALVQQAWTGDKDSMTAAAAAHIATAASRRSAGRLPAGAVLRAVLLPGAGRRLLRLHRGDPGRADDQADAGPRPAAPHRDHRADVRGRAAGAVLQHRRGHRRRRQLPRQVPEEPPAAGQGVLGEVLLPPGQPRLPDLRHRGRPDRRLHLLRPALPGGLAGARPGRRADRVQPVGHLAAASPRTCGTWSSPPPRSPTSTTSARSTGSASSRWATTTSTASPTSSTRAASWSARPPSDNADEVIVRDLDMDKLTEVRDLWQFYRDRRPDSYETLVNP